MIRKSRTMLERAKSIFQYLNLQIDPISSGERLSKSKFQEIGISPREIDKWLELIIFIQSCPKISLTKEKSRTYINLKENKFMLLMRKHYNNTNLSYSEREAAIILYFKSMLTLERISSEDISLTSIVDSAFEMELDRPTITRIAEYALQEMNSS